MGVNRQDAQQKLQGWFLGSLHGDIGQDVLAAQADVTLDMARASGLTTAEGQLWFNDDLFLTWSENLGASIIASQLRVRLHGQVPLLHYPSQPLVA